MHTNVTLGPLMYVMIGLMVLVGLGALVLTLDVLRPRPKPVPGGWPAKLFWALPQVAYVLAVVASRLIGRVTVLSTIGAVLFFLAGPLQVAYLLKVVFPKGGGHPGSAVPEALRAAPSDTDSEPFAEDDAPLGGRARRSADDGSPRRARR